MDREALLNGIFLFKEGLINRAAGSAVSGLHSPASSFSMASGAINLFTQGHAPPHSCLHPMTDWYGGKPVSLDMGVEETQSLFNFE